MLKNKHVPPEIPHNKYSTAHHTIQSEHKQPPQIPIQAWDEINLIHTYLHLQDQPPHLTSPCDNPPGSETTKVEEEEGQTYHIIIWKSF